MLDISFYKIVFQYHLSLSLSLSNNSFTGRKRDDVLGSIADQFYLIFN